MKNLPKFLIRNGCPNLALIWHIIRLARFVSIPNLALLKILNDVFPKLFSANIDVDVQGCPSQVIHT